MRSIQIADAAIDVLAAEGFPNPTVQATLLVSGVDGLCHDMLLHPEMTIDPDEIDGILHRWLEAEQRAPHPVRRASDPPRPMTRQTNGISGSIPANMRP